MLIFCSKVLYANDTKDLDVYNKFSGEIYADRIYKGTYGNLEFECRGNDYSWTVGRDNKQVTKFMYNDVKIKINGIKDECVTQQAIDDISYLISYIMISKPGIHPDHILLIECDSLVKLDMSNVCILDKLNLVLSDNIIATGNISNCYSIEMHLYENLTISEVGLNLNIRVSDIASLSLIKFNISWFDGNVKFIIMDKDANIDRNVIIKNVLGDFVNILCIEFVNPDKTVFIKANEELLKLMNGIGYEKDQLLEAMNQYIKDHLSVEGLDVRINKVGELYVSGAIDPSKKGTRMKYDAQHINELFRKVNTLNINFYVFMKIEWNRYEPTDAIDLTNVNFGLLGSNFVIELGGSFNGVVNNSSENAPLIQFGKYSECIRGIVLVGKNFNLKVDDNTMNVITKSDAIIDISVPLEFEINEGFLGIKDLSTSEIMKNLQNIIDKIDAGFSNSESTLNIKLAYMLMGKSWLFKKNKGISKIDLTSFVDEHLKYQAKLIDTFTETLDGFFGTFDNRFGENCIKANEYTDTIKNDELKFDVADCSSYDIKVNDTTDILYDGKYYKIDELMKELNQKRMIIINEEYVKIMKKFNDNINEYNPGGKYEIKENNRKKPLFDKILNEYSGIINGNNDQIEILCKLKELCVNDMSNMIDIRSIEPLKDSISRDRVISRLWYDNDINNTGKSGLRYTDYDSKTLFDGESFHLSDHKQRFHYDGGNIELAKLDEKLMNEFRHNDENPSKYFGKMLSREIGIYFLQLKGFSDEDRNKICLALSEDTRKILTEIGMDNKMNLQPIDDLFEKHKNQINELDRIAKVTNEAKKLEDINRVKFEYGELNKAREAEELEKLEEQQRLEDQGIKEAEERKAQKEAEERKRKAEELKKLEEKRLEDQRVQQEAEKRKAQKEAEERKRKAEEAEIKRKSKGWINMKRVFGIIVGLCFLLGLFVYQKSKDAAETNSSKDAMEDDSIENDAYKFDDIDDLELMSNEIDV